MAQNNYYTFKQNSINGNILMNAQVFDEIVKKTVKQLDGVSLDASKGIQIPGTKALATCTIKDNVVYIRLSVSIKYGVNISKKTKEVQEAIATNIKDLTDVDVNHIDIEVESIDFE